jgi:HSP20 family protein
MPISDLIPWKRIGVEGTSDAESGLELSNLQRDMNRLFEDFFDRPFGISPLWGEETGRKRFLPDVDLKETDQEVVLSVDLPGMNPDEIDISVTGNTFTISGEKSSEDQKKGEGYYRRERSYGSFRRSIPLPTEVDKDNTKATYKQGVLKVVMPKIPSEKTSQTKIKIKQG